MQRHQLTAALHGQQAEVTDFFWPDYFSCWRADLQQHGRRYRVVFDGRDGYLELREQDTAGDWPLRFERDALGLTEQAQLDQILAWMRTQG